MKTYINLVWTSHARLDLYFILIYFFLYFHRIRLKSTSLLCDCWDILHNQLKLSFLHTLILSKSVLAQALALDQNSCHLKLLHCLCASQSTKPHPHSFATRETDVGSGSGLIQARADTKKLIWMIAHKCLTTQGVDDAILNGANAVEMDLTAYKEGWWAQHTGEIWYDPIGTHFDHIASRKAGGINIQWVWLDIQTSDAFGVTDGFSSIQGLQNLVRDKLLPHGVTALYGFAVCSSPALTFVKQSLTSAEAINYDGFNDDHSQNITPKQSIKSLQDVAIARRVSSYGWDHLKNSFGDCYESDFYTCTQLRQAKTSKY